MMKRNIQYIKDAEEVFSKYNGEYLAVDDNPSLIERSWNYSRTVLIKFESRDDFDIWYNSEDYKNILKFRLNAADCDSILIKGKEK